MAEEQENEQIDEATPPKLYALIVRGFVSKLVYDPENYSDEVFTIIGSDDAGAMDDVKVGQRWTGTEFADPVIRRHVQVRDGVVENACDAPEGWDAGDGSEFIPSETAQTGDLYEDGEFTTPEPIPVDPPPPVPSLVASGVFSVTDGWLEGVGAAAGIGMAFALDVGTYWIMFSDPQPDLGYAAPASSSQGQINVQRNLEYVEVTVRDGSGSLIDPSEFSITIMRAM